MKLLEAFNQAVSFVQEELCKGSMVVYSIKVVDYEGTKNNLKSVEFSVIVIENLVDIGVADYYDEVFFVVYPDGIHSYTPVRDRL